MRNRLYGGVRGRKMKVGGNYFIFLLLDLFPLIVITSFCIRISGILRFRLMRRRKVDICQ
jgi:hypothetical protein